MNICLSFQSPIILYNPRTEFLMLICIKFDWLATQSEPGLGGVASNLVIFSIIFLSLSISSAVLCVNMVNNANSHSPGQSLFGHSLSFMSRNQIFHKIISVLIISWSGAIFYGFYNFADWWLAAGGRWSGWVNQFVSAASVSVLLDPIIFLVWQRRSVISPDPGWRHLCVAVPPPGSDTRYMAS